jgi:hypothetical protein
MLNVLGRWRTSIYRDGVQGVECSNHSVPTNRINDLGQPQRWPFLCAPSMGALLWVKVPPRADRSERSEAQLRKGDRLWGGSVERNCEPMYKNRIEGATEQGERA